MENKENKTYELALLYFEGKISPENESVLFEYISKDKKNEYRFRQWEKDWMLSEKSNPDIVKEWDRCKVRIQTREIVSPMIHIKTLSVWRKVAAIAAIVVLSIGGTIGISKMITASESNEFFVLEAPYGEKSKIILSDGSLVWLNAGSTIRYSSNFNKSDRNIELDGEAYFEVTKHNDKPFIVKTQKYDVLVKGTKFNVSSYKDEPFVTTTLMEGSIELQYQNKCFRMKAGECNQLDTRSNKFTQTPVHSEQYKSWIEDRIEYDAITLQELIFRLSRQYNVNIYLDPNNDIDKSFSISLHNKETIREVLDGLSKAIPIKIQYKGKDIYISS